MASSEIVPLARRLWSQEARDSVDENDEILTVVRGILEVTRKRGILVFDRGGDRGFFYDRWVCDESIGFIIRQRGDRNLLYKAKTINTLQLAMSDPLWGDGHQGEGRQGDGPSDFVWVFACPPCRAFIAALVAGCGQGVWAGAVDAFDYSAHA